MKRIVRQSSVAGRLLAASAIAFAVAALATSVLAQSSPFPSALERLLWKDLGPWTPLVHNTPSSAAILDIDLETLEPKLDIFGNPVYVSPFANFDDEFAALQPGECSYSTFGDWDEYGLAWVDYGSSGPRTRQCKDADGDPTPPPAGALLDPVGLAVDGERVYVADNFNHRVQVFDFFGRATELAYPIGNGVPGRGPIDGSNQTSGELLNAPEGLAVDAAHRLAVADGWNKRIAVFNDQGLKLFEHDLTPGIASDFKPASLAISPGATLIDPAAAEVPTGAAVDHRVVALDWTHCQVRILDTKFNFVRSLPEQLPPEEMRQDPDDACWNPEFHTTADGEFSTVTGVAIDKQNRIYITDASMNAVQVFDKDGNSLGSIGRPGEQPAPGELSGPVGVMLDHLDRLGVIDGMNSRVVFYSLTFDGNDAPTATFEFQLDVNLAVEDFPMGLAEQWGPKPADNPSTAFDESTLNDPKGRFLATDPRKRQVLRFELPELAIVNLVADNGTGSFDVVVPRQKASPVLGVEVEITHVELGQVLAATPSTAQDIDNGDLVSYTFTYTPTSPTSTFTVTARGDYDADSDTYLANADPVQTVARAACVGCAATHVVYNDPAPATGSPVPAQLHTGGPNGDWYGQEVFVRITPTIPKGNKANASSTVAGIGYFFGGVAAQAYGASIQEVSTSGAVDVSVRVAGVSSLTYWAVSQEGSVGPRVTVPLPVDLEGPHASFTWTPHTGIDPQGEKWWNASVSTVTGSYTLTELHSGIETDPHAGSVEFTLEKREQALTFDVIDYVGHATQVDTIGSSGGTTVNIDRGAPTLTAPADITVGQNYAGYAILAPGEFVASASDPDLASGEEGSGIAFLTDVGTTQFPTGVTTTVEFIARDYAGNETKRTATVTVLAKAPSTVTYNGQTTVQYGESLNLSAFVTPSAAPGSVTFTLTIDQDTAIAVTDEELSASMGTGTIPSVLFNVGTYTLNVEYSGDEDVDSASTTAQIVVQPAPITVKAENKSRVYGNADPALTTVILDGELFGTDTFSGSLTRVAGDSVGTYAINQGTLALSSNYALTFEPGTLTITTRFVRVKADSLTKLAGTPDPVPLTFYYLVGSLAAGDSFSGAPTRDPGEAPGAYRIHQGTLSLNANYLFEFDEADFTIFNNAITVKAFAERKTYGSPDPVLHFRAFLPDGTEVPVANLPFSGSLARDPGESVDGYVIHQGTLDLPVGFTILYHNALFYIDPKGVTVVAGSPSKVFGSADPAITVTHNGFLPADNIALTATRDPGQNVGNYKTTPHAAGAALGNYTVAYVTGLLSITPFPVTVTPRNKTVPVGSVDPVFDFDYGAFPPGYSAANVVTPPTCGVAGAHSVPGTYAITCSGAVADNGNMIFTYASGLFTVLSDNQPPVCLAATGGQIWPPNHKKFYAAPIAGVTDPEGQPITFLITGIWQDEQLDSTGDGKFTPDGQGVGTSTAWVRAERNGHGNKAKGDGRVYEILFRATDSKGAYCDGSVIWTVPHDQGKNGAAIDSGIRIDSTGVIPGTKNKSQIHQNSPQP